jgi:hypothetical protein
MTPAMGMHHASTYYTVLYWQLRAKLPTCHGVAPSIFGLSAPAPLGFILLILGAMSQWVITPSHHERAEGGAPLSCKVGRIDSFFPPRVLVPWETEGAIEKPLVQVHIQKTSLVVGRRPDANRRIISFATHCAITSGSVAVIAHFILILICGR